MEQLEAALTGRYSLLAAWWRPGRPSTTWSWNSLTGAQREDMLDRLCERADLPTRRFAARLSVEAGRLGVRELALRASCERDPATARLWTDAALRAMAADGPDDAAVDALLAGDLPMVRACGVTALRGAGRAAEAERYLTDRSDLVRACARRLVRQGGGDPYEHHPPARCGPPPRPGCSRGRSTSSTPSTCGCAGPGSVSPTEIVQPDPDTRSIIRSWESSTNA